MALLPPWRSSSPPVPLPSLGQLSVVALGTSTVATSACLGTVVATMGRDLAVGVVGRAIAAAMAVDLTVVSLFAATFSVDQRPLLIGAGAAGRLTAAATFTSQHDHLSCRRSCRGSIGSRRAHRRSAPRRRRLPSGVPPGLLPCTGLFAGTGVPDNVAAVVVGQRPLLRKS